jgi:succinate dehydrogenase / fumarate reductase iron-sulfur subunit
MSGSTYKLRVWRQAGPAQPGKLAEYNIGNVSPEMSFLEMLDLLNEDLIARVEEPVAFDSDCREGICGACGLVIDGVPHGPKSQVSTCELRMRSFDPARTLVVEPFRAAAFPIIKDLVVDRSAFDRVMSAVGYVSSNTGSAPEANSVPVPKGDADEAMDAAACIGCAGCVAACPNASASLFVGAKVSQYAFTPQGQAERVRRVLRMVQQMDAEGFGDCSNFAECEAVCPAGISIFNIGRMRREYMKASLFRASDD